MPSADKVFKSLNDRQFDSFDKSKEFNELVIYMHPYVGRLRSSAPKELYISQSNACKLSGRDIITISCQA